MSEKKAYKKIIVCMFSMVLLISAIGVLPLMGIKDESDDHFSKDRMDNNSLVPPKTGTRAGSPRTVLAELFTNWGCSACPKAGRAINELMDVYDRSELVMVSYHINGPRSDDPICGYNKDEINQRRLYYNVTSVPELYLDGPPRSPIHSYDEYKQRIDNRLMDSSNLTIRIEGYLDFNVLTGVVNVTIDVTDSLPIGSLTVRFMVVEDNLFTPNAPNGEEYHRFAMRDMLTDEPLPSLTEGETYDVSRSFPIDLSLNMDAISVVVFVQNDDDQAVLQAGTYDFIPQDILIVDDDDSSHPTGYEDGYQELLSEMEYAFDGWTLNERGSPTSQDLEGYEAVIWITATTSSSTLTSSDCTAISEYLDNERGSVFITGENIGNDIGSTLFYQNYLHSTFINDNSGESNIKGISNDPISDPFSGSSIPVSSGSPSEISPISPASLVFTYSSSGNPGGIKAAHDFDSKIVYFDFMYFEGSDSNSNKKILMERILNWMMNLTYSIQLSDGWNLISIPLVQPQTSLNSVLESIENDYDSVQWYDPSDANKPWKHYKKEKPFGNDLNELSHEISFWVHITKSSGTEISCKGTAPIVNQNIDLHLGWNLVGYPSLSYHSRDTALNNINFGSDVNSIWTYNRTLHQWEELGPSDEFEPSNGYWIHSLVEKTWNVPL